MNSIPLQKLVTVIRMTLVTLFAFFILSGEYPEVKDGKEVIYVGTQDGRGSQGLYIFEFDRSSGQMNQLQTVSDREGPNFQALHPKDDYLYSVSNEAFSEDSGYGTITAYQINPQTGFLTRINEQSTMGQGPTHVSIDPKGRFAYVSNFSTGNLSVFAIKSDGSLSKAVDVIQHKGRSKDEQRQTGPHVHSIIPSTDGRFIYVSDMGIDKIMIYEVDQGTGHLSPAEIPYVKNIPGSGPRHFTIHPNGELAYSLEQISSTVSVFHIEQSNGALTEIQRVNMLPENFKVENQAADVHISSDGRFLYASNRGHDSLVIYKIETNGRLTLIGHEPTRGAHPRNFMVDRGGEYLLVANRDDDNIVLFHRDKGSGELSYTGKQIHLPLPVCLTQYRLN